MSLLSSNYIEDQYITKLINYKYSGGDNSILYRYVINPFCNKFVTYLPTWLAPNVITVSGFFFNLFNLILTHRMERWGPPPHMGMHCLLNILYHIYNFRLHRWKASSKIKSFESFRTFSRSWN